MKKKLVLSLAINENNQRFELEDKFSELLLGEMTATLGFLSSLLHNYQHIHAEKQNQYVLKHKETN